MNARTRTRLAQIGSFVLAGILLYLALRGVDFSEIGHVLHDANYLWLIPLVFIVLFSHWLRAWRWKVLVDVLPEVREPERNGRGVSTTTAFYSVMIGYMVNYVAPRLGEVVRSANLARQERLQFSGIFGTVVVERILDMIVLLIGLAVTAVLLLDQYAEIDRLFLRPMVEGIGRIPMAGLALLALFVAVLVGIGFWSAARYNSPVQRFWAGRVQPLLASFKEGLLTLLRTRRRGVLLISTVGMWLCYALMAYLPFQLLHLAAPYGISFADAFAIMIIGAVGIVIPSPGGTGSYHFITTTALHGLFAMDLSAAAAYAVLTHGAQMILYILSGFVAILIQGSGFSGLTTAEETVPVDEPERRIEAAEVE